MSNSDETPKSTQTTESERAGCVFVGFIFGLVIATIVWGSIFTICSNQWRTEAIRNGAAEYVISDPETGKTEWRWKKGAAKTTEEK